MKRRHVVIVMALNLLVLILIGTVISLVTLSTAKPVTTNSSQLTIADYPPNTLQMVHIVIRHGARTPADTYPKDPYINSTFSPIGWGRLTNEGKLQMYETGKFLRKRYNKFLGDLYEPMQYKTQATGVDRTQSSVQLINAGLWPPKNVQKWGPLDWQPIPVQYQTTTNDSLLLVNQPCPQYHIELNRVLSTDDVKSKIQEYQSLFNELSEHTGKRVQTFDDVQDVFSTLYAEQMAGMRLPEWTKNYFPEQMLKPTAFSFVLNAYTDKLKRLKGGVLLKKIVDDWQKRINTSQAMWSQKAYLFGGHDSTVTNLLSALNVWDEQLPVFGIMALLELHRNPSTNEYTVQIHLKNGTTDNDLHQLTVPGCHQNCPIENLEPIIQPLLPTHWEEECQTAIEDYTVPPIRGP